MGLRGWILLVGGVAALSSCGSGVTAIQLPGSGAPVTFSAGGPAPIPTTPVPPSVYPGVIDQTVQIDAYTLRLSDLTSSTCGNTAPPGEGFLFVEAVVTRATAAADQPDVGALAWTLADSQGRSFTEPLGQLASCEPPGPPGGFTLEFAVPGTASGLRVLWNPGDTTGHVAVISLGR